MEWTIEAVVQRLINIKAKGYIPIPLVVLGGNFPTERICVIFQSNDSKAI